jgi:hypothetical protein
LRIETIIIMRKIFTLLLLVAGYSVAAQQYNNEWINFDQTYYKFKVGKTGVFRIPRTSLDAIGIGGTQVEFFELWRNGQKVPFYTSVATGALPADGYIEFWATINDGKPDKQLYRDPAFQHTDVPSLITDTASYFLSVNMNQSGFRYVTVTNDVAGNTRPVEPYFMYTAAIHNKVMANLGFAAVVGEYVYSSSYDKGEFLSSGNIGPSTPLTQNLTQLQVNTSGPNASFRFGAVGNALNPRTIKVRINGTDVIDTLMDYFNDVHTTISIPNSLITPATVPIQFVNTSGIGTDRMVVSYFELNYPRNFVFNNTTNFEFTLPAKPEGYYLQITSFNTGGVAPVLYDMANGERFVGDIGVAGMVRFALPGTAIDRKLVLVNSTVANTTAVSTLTSRLFTRYNLVPNQGNYIIVSHASLHTGTSGNDPVLDYKNYRQSAAGGGYTVLVADVEEVIDQFGFGIKKHPIAVRNFLRYARTFFSIPPRFAFMMGKGMTYIDYRKNQAAADVERLNLVPTFGYPGSDNMLASPEITNPIVATPIGRLSVINGKEIEDYLEKIKEYELAQKTAPNTIADRAWMKNVVHVTGSSDPYLGTVLCHYMDVYRQIIEDTAYGAIVSNFCKTSTNPVEQISSGRLENLFAEGISFLTYFGHSSSTTLEFNIDNPQNYNNPGKYPLFFVNGCNAGNFFTYNPQRLVANETLSEKFTLAKQRGSIAFVASTHYGIVNYLNLYLTNLYNTISYTDYGKSIGEIQRNAMQKMVNATGPFDFYARAHAEEITLHGDPAIAINGQAKPDYVIEESSIKITPTLVTLSDIEFTVRARVVNIGKAVSDSLMVTIKHQLPDGSVDTLFHGKIAYVPFSDSISILVKIDPLRHKGANRIIVTVDSDEAINEIDETNNTNSREFYILEDEARPVYPYNLAIIKNPTQKLYASSANPLAASMQYLMEMDTTAAFNSGMKITKSVTSKGGVLEFDPGITYTDSTVYYWRTAPVPTTGSPLWVSASFTYIQDQEGWNQSHRDQHKQSTQERVYYDTLSRDWKFGRRTNNLFIINGVYPTGALNDNDLTVSVNGSNYIRSACVGNSIVFNIFDSVTFKPWKNVGPSGNNLNLYGSANANCQPTRNYNFEFRYTTAAERKKIMDFMDILPNGVIVVARSFDAPVPTSFSSTWRADTSLYGSNNSVYHRLLAAGFTDIDSLDRRRAWILVYKKNDNSFTPKFKYTPGVFERATLSVDITTPDTLGYVTSPKFGPAKLWRQVQWAGSSIEEPSNDNPSVEVIGVDAGGIESTLYILDRFTQDVDISGIDPTIYPYVRLRMRNADSMSLTPYQLRYWRILYDPVPEGAMAANLFFTSKDSLEVGENLEFGVAFKNVSSVAFDSIHVKINVIDRTNIVHPFTINKLKPIAPGAMDTVRVSIPTTGLPGENVLFVDVNADNHQPEQFHFNNFLYRNFYARLDKVNPLLDVTFDGVHILNRDIVSAKPHIQIKLKDEAKYLLLNDTALSLVQIKYPDGNIRTFNFDGDTLRFTPASSGEDNTATIDFNPAFLGSTDNDGEEYELIVRGKDRSNNRSGDAEYRISFRVISKPMISNLLNYPNPFSTSTAFVFTVTGTEIPQNIKIQILTVTGKIVREITKDELGPLHIGRNITEFKWDGTDQYGQKLGNGVYLYRVVTTMNGKPMEKYRAQGDDTDKYFTNGYGKMYLMR